DDDCTTAGGIATLYESVNDLNRFVEQERQESGKADPAKIEQLKQGALLLKELGGVLGLFRAEPQLPSAGADDELVGRLVQLLIDVRADARKSKNFAMADKIRNELAELGIVLEDRPTGTEWTRA